MVKTSPQTKTEFDKRVDVSLKYFAKHYDVDSKTLDLAKDVLKGKGNGQDFGYGPRTFYWNTGETQEVNTYEGRFTVVKELLGLNESTHYRGLEWIAKGNKYLAKADSKAKGTEGMKRLDVVNNYVHGLYEGAKSVENGPLKDVRGEVNDLEKTLEKTEKKLDKSRQTSKERGKQNKAYERQIGELEGNLDEQGVYAGELEDSLQSEAEGHDSLMNYTSDVEEERNNLRTDVKDANKKTKKARWFAGLGIPLAAAAGAAIMYLTSGCGVVKNNDVVSPSLAEGSNGVHSSHTMMLDDISETNKPNFYQIKVKDFSSKTEKTDVGERAVANTNTLANAVSANAAAVVLNKNSFGDESLPESSQNVGGGIDLVDDSMFTATTNYINNADGTTTREITHKWDKGEATSRLTYGKKKGEPSEQAKRIAERKVKKVSESYPSRDLEEVLVEDSTWKAQGSYPTDEIEATMTPMDAPYSSGFVYVDHSNNRNANITNGNITFNPLDTGKSIWNHWNIWGDQLADFDDIGWGEEANKARGNRFVENMKAIGDILPGVNNNEANAQKKEGNNWLQRGIQKVYHAGQGIVGGTLNGLGFVDGGIVTDKVINDVAGGAIVHGLVNPAVDTGNLIVSVPGATAQTLEGWSADNDGKFSRKAYEGITSLLRFGGNVILHEAPIDGRYARIVTQEGKVVYLDKGQIGALAESFVAAGIDGTAIYYGIDSLKDGGSGNGGNGSGSTPGWDPGHQVGN